MASLPAELPRVDAELEELAAGVDLDRALSLVRSAAPVADLGGVDEALSALAGDVPVPAAPRSKAARPAPAPPPPRASVRPKPVAEPAPRVEAVPVAAEPVVAAPAPAPVAVLEVDDDDDDDVLSVSAAASAPVVEAAPVDDALLNPFEDPSPEPEGDAQGEDDSTLIIDARELGGLDMDALFDGMVEDALSAPLDGVSGPALGRSSRPSTDPPEQRRARAEGATDIEQLRPEGEDDDLELFVDDDAIALEADDALDGLEALEAPADIVAAGEGGDPDDGGGKKKGFFKKLFG